MLGKLKKTSAKLLEFLGLKDLPVENGQLNLSEEQTQKLTEAMGEDTVTQIVNAFNSELADFHNKKSLVSEEDLKAINSELDTVLRVHAPRSDLEDQAPEETNLKDKVDQLVKSYGTAQEQIKDLTGKVKTLSELPEVDSPLLQNSKITEQMKHSATHLFASGKGYDALDRNWNARVLNPSVSATDWTDPVNIATLNNDLKLYYRDYPDEIKSLERDNFDLPSFWKKKTKVTSETFTASVVTGEITQARKASWLPKNKHHLEAEKGLVYPIQIDIEYKGYDLQKIENSWLNFMNAEGSQPKKMRFVVFLVNEIRKKQRVEDRIATINGVYVPTPEDAAIPGKYLNRQNGLRYILWVARDVVKKYRAFNLGIPTYANMIDYVDTFIASLPDEVKNRTDLVYYLSPSYLKMYKDRYEDLYAQNTDYKGLPTHPRNYPNIEFCPLVDLEGASFMFITTKDNISILEMIPAERGMYTFETLKRNLFLYGDYKMGIMLDHIGNSKVKPTDPDAFKVQTVWSNNVPIFESRYKAYLYDDQTGEISANHNFIAVNPDWKTDITKIVPLAKGQLIKITGDAALENSKVIKKGTDLDLASDFDLKSGGTLTLISLDKEGKWKEISRTTEPETLPLAVNFTNVIEAVNAVDFKFNGTADTTLIKITEGVEGQIITITGNDTAKITIPKALDNVQLNADLEISGAATSIQLVFVDGIWYNYKTT